MSFYVKFIELCAKKGISSSAVAEKIGLSRASAYGWKNGALPNDVNLQKIADYFNVTTEYFKNKEEESKEKPLLENEERIMELYKMTEGLTETEIIALKAFCAGLKANHKQD